MKKMTRNEFLKMAGTSAALVVINTALVPTAIAAEPIGTVLSAKKSVNTGTAVSSATFELVPISRQTFWGDSDIFWSACRMELIGSNKND